MTAPAPTVLNFKPFDKNTLRGFFDLELPSGMILCGCTLHEKNGHHWTGLPGRSWTKPDGSQSWAKIVDFKDKATGDRFQEIVTPIALAAYGKTRRAVA